MPNIFEGPWLILILSAVLIFIIAILRQFRPQAYRWWLSAIPILVAAAGIYISWAVETDYEKVRNLLNRGIDATINRDIDGLADIISPDYSDKSNSSKEHILAKAENLLASCDITSIRKLQGQILAQAGSAEIKYSFRVHFRPLAESETIETLVYVQMKLTAVRGPDKKWLISSAELVSINNSPTGWRDI